MGKRNPVKLVSAVVKRKSAVVTGNLFEANIPPTTISPLPIATRVIMTCKIVKAPTDIPRIMESPRCWRARLLRSLVERGVHHKIDGRRGFVPGHVTLAEIAREVVVSCLRVRPCNAAKAARHLRLHSKSRKFVDDLLHLVRR